MANKTRQQIAAKQGMFHQKYCGDVLSNSKVIHFYLKAEMRVLKLEEATINKISAKVNDQLNRLKVFKYSSIITSIFYYKSMY